MEQEKRYQKPILEDTLVQAELERLAVEAKENGYVLPVIGFEQFEEQKRIARRLDNLLESIPERLEKLMDNYAGDFRQEGKSILVNDSQMTSTPVEILSITRNGLEIRTNGYSLHKIDREGKKKFTSIAVYYDPRGKGLDTVGVYLSYSKTEVMPSCYSRLNTVARISLSATFVSAAGLVAGIMNPELGGEIIKYASIGGFAAGIGGIIYITGKIHDLGESTFVKLSDLKNTTKYSPELVREVVELPGKAEELFKMHIEAQKEDLRAIEWKPVK